MALNQRQPQAGLIMHTDRGSQYVADRYLQLRHYHGITPSMSRKGNCWDNAGAESFFHTLKTECVYLETFDTREQAQDVIFEYIGFTIVSVVIRSMATWPQWSMRRPKKQLNCLSGKVLTDHPPHHAVIPKPAASCPRRRGPAGPAVAPSRCPRAARRRGR